MKTTSLHRGHLILMSGLMLLVTFLAPQVTLKAAQPAPPDPPEPVSVQVEPVLPQVDAPPAPEILAPVLPDTVLEASVPVEPQAPQQPFPLEAVVPDLPEPILPQPPRRPIPGQAANPRYQWEKDGVRYVVETEGDITLSDDHRTIQRISSDGHFFGQTGIGQSRTTIDVTPGTGGLLAYEFRVRGELKPFDAAGHSRNEAKVWLADMLLSWQEIREEMADMEEEMGKLQLDMERRQIDRAQLQEHMVNMNQALSADMLQSQAELRRSMVDMQESMRHLELDKMQSLLEAERQLKKANDLAANQIRLDLAEKMALNEDKLRAAQDMMIQLERSHLDREGNTFKQVYDAMLRARDLIEHNRPNVDELKQIREALRNLEEAIQDLETDG